MKDERLLREDLSKVLTDFETIQDPKELDNLIVYLEGILNFYNEITEYPIVILQSCITQMRHYDATRTELIGKLKACIVCMDHRIAQEGEK